MTFYYLSLHPLLQPADIPFLLFLSSKELYHLHTFRLTKSLLNTPRHAKSELKLVSHGCLDQNETQTEGLRFLVLFHATVPPAVMLRLQLVLILC